MQILNKQLTPAETTLQVCKHPDYAFAVVCIDCKQEAYAYGRDFRHAAMLQHVVNRDIAAGKYGKTCSTCEYYKNNTAG